MAPRPDLLDPLGAEMLADLPPFLRSDPDLRAVFHCYGREFARAGLTVEDVRAQLFSVRATSLGLPWWERLLGLPVAPADQTLETRRAGVGAAFLATLGGNSVREVAVGLTALIGSSWSAQEHVPGDATTPPAYTVRFAVPYAPGTPEHERVDRYLRARLDAHIAIELQYNEQFLVGLSGIGQAPIGGTP